MMANAESQEGTVISTITYYQKIEVLMLVGGILFLGAVAVAMLFAIHKINKERISIF
jgi:hypothetical protein